MEEGKHNFRGNQKQYNAFLDDLYKQSITDLKGMVRFLIMKYRDLEIPEATEAVKIWYKNYEERTNLKLDKKQLGIR